jgi:superfamily II DNA or RNA helicase
LTKWLERNQIKYKFIDKTVTVPLSFEIDSSIKLRGYQEESLSIAVKRAGGVIVLPAGGGKTEVGIQLIAQLKQRTIVLVHTLALLDQWKRRVENTLGIECGVIQGKTEDLREITIASIHTLRQKNYPKEFYKMWGMVILEEAHHAPASSFQSIIQRFHARYRYGITADTVRTDGMEKILFSVIGEPFTVTNLTSLAEDGFAIAPKIQSIKSNFETGMNTNNWHTISDLLISSEDRNNLITRKIQECVDQDKRVLVLSDRKEHLYNIFKNFTEGMKGLYYTRSKTAILTADNKPAEREALLHSFKTGELLCLLCTQIADEGIDIPNLDCVILAFPGKSRAKAIQRIGRLQRIFPGKTEGIVYDIVDFLDPILYRQYLIRRSIYLELGFHVDSLIPAPKHHNDARTKAKNWRNIHTPVRHINTIFSFSIFTLYVYIATLCFNIKEAHIPPDSNPYTQRKK